jgi:hypothetical protein
MLKDLFKTILLLSAVVIGGNLIALCQKATDTMPAYIILLTIICMLVVLWTQFIKLMKGN